MRSSFRSCRPWKRNLNEEAGPRGDYTLALKRPVSEQDAFLPEKLMAWQMIIEGGEELTAEQFALEANLTAEQAQKILDEVAAPEAEATSLQGIDKKKTADGKIVYYALKAPDMSKVRVVIFCRGRRGAGVAVSDSLNPKQFRSFSQDGKTMLQKTVDRVMQLGIPKEHILIATRASFVDQVKQSVTADFPAANILGEPAKKDWGGPGVEPDEPGARDHGRVFARGPCDCGAPGG